MSGGAAYGTRNTERALNAVEHVLMTVLLLGMFCVGAWVSWWASLSTFGAFLIGCLSRDLYKIHCELVRSGAERSSSAATTESRET